MALGEVPHQGLNDSEGTSWVKKDSSESVIFWRFVDKKGRKEKKVADLTVFKALFSLKMETTLLCSSLFQLKLSPIKLAKVPARGESGDGRVKTNFLWHGGEPTGSQGQISHLNWVSEGLRNGVGTQREATLNTKESLKRGF